MAICTGLVTSRRLACGQGGDKYEARTGVVLHECEPVPSFNQQRVGVTYSETGMGWLFPGTRAIVDACYSAWNSLIAETGCIRSLTDFE